MTTWYEEMVEWCGGTCPIESGVIGALAEHECQHGSLPDDPHVGCNCFEEPIAPLPPVEAVAEHCPEEEVLEPH